MNSTEKIPYLNNICIVIPTYNRADILAKSLSKFHGITHIDKATILIIDNNSNDHTKEVISAFKDETNLNIVYYFEPVQGLSVAKNTAIKVCRQDYMLFLDDDCYPQSDILLECAKYMLLPNVFVVGKVKRWTELVSHWIEDDFFIRNPPVDSKIILSDMNYVKGCILLIATDLAKSLDGYNTRLGMNGNKVAYGEDTDLGHKAIKEGIPVWYDPGICMYHRSHFNTVQDFIKKHYFAGQAYQIIRVKKKGSMRLAALVFYSLLRAPIIFILFLFKSANWKGAIVASFSNVSNYTGQLSSRLKSMIQSLKRNTT